MKEQFEHRTIDVGQVRLHIAEAKPKLGPGKSEDDAPLVIFLHGFPEFWWSWRRQLSAFRDAGFWAIAPDLRGYGDSEKPFAVGEYEVEKLAGDVAGIIRACGRKKAFVVGHDWGAVVAWAFAAEYPELLERLAILNVPHPLSFMKGLRTLRQIRKSWYMFAFQLPKIPELMLARNDYEFARRTFEVDGMPAADIEQYVAALRKPGVARSAINYYRAAMRRVATGRTPRVRPIDKPVLVIWGDRDRYLGIDLADPPKRFVPDQRVVHIPSASHWVQADEPVKVNELLVEFFGPN